MALKIALAGNPNCGKTTMFNALTGANQYVGNWPGVTVEKKEGKLKASSSGEEIIITDLPGIYSLSPYTLEEVVSRDYLLKERPQAIINLVDATNIERNLYLTTQVLELGIPVVIALNMADLLAKSGDRIDTKKLGELFGCQVVETSALKGTGLKEVVDKAVDAAKKNAWRAPAHIFSLEVENSISRVEEALGSAVDEKQKRWYAIKLLERDEKVMEQLRLPASILSAVSAEAARLEKEMDDDTESIITDARYNYIGEVIEKAVKKAPRQMTTSDKIDRIVTNRIFGTSDFCRGHVACLLYFRNDPWNHGNRLGQRYLRRRDHGGGRKLSWKPWRQRFNYRPGGGWNPGRPGGCIRLPSADGSFVPASFHFGGYRIHGADRVRNGL